MSIQSLMEHLVVVASQAAIATIAAVARGHKSLCNCENLLNILDCSGCVSRTPWRSVVQNEFFSTNHVDTWVKCNSYLRLFYV